MKTLEEEIYYMRKSQIYSYSDSARHRFWVVADMYRIITGEWTKPVIDSVRNPEFNQDIITTRASSELYGILMYFTDLLPEEAITYYKTMTEMIEFAEQDIKNMAKVEKQYAEFASDEEVGKHLSRGSDYYYYIHGYVNRLYTVTDNAYHVIAAYYGFDIPEDDRYRHNVQLKLKGVNNKLRRFLNTRFYHAPVQEDFNQFRNVVTHRSNECRFISRKDGRFSDVLLYNGEELDWFDFVADYFKHHVDGVYRALELLFVNEYPCLDLVTKDERRWEISVFNSDGSREAVH